MRRFISCCLIAILLINTPVNARAAVPLPAVAGGVLAITLATGVYIYHRSGSNYAVTDNFVSRASDAAWYSRGAATVGLMLATRPISMRIPTNNVMAAAKADPAKYPKLSAATLAGPVLLDRVNSLAASVGQIYSNPSGSPIKITSYTPGHTGGWSSWSCSDHWSNGQVDFAGAPRGTTGDCFAGVKIRFSVVPPPPPSPATPAQFRTSIAPAGVVTDSALQAELDKMISDPTYVPEFTDDTTGLPWAPPADVVRPEKWTEIDERSKAIAAAQSAVDAARTAVNELQNRHNAAVAAANADPTNPEKQRELSDLAIALGTAQARLAELEQQLATLIADAEADTNDPDPPVDPGDVPTLKTINWSYGTKLLGSLETAWPFNLLLSLRGMLSPLEASPVAPSFTLPIWGGNNISLSLSVFDPVALVLRWSLSLLLTVGAVMAVVRWYRGGS